MLYIKKEFNGVREFREYKTKEMHFALWKAMAEKADLYTVHTAIAGFRKHSAQKTSDM